MTAAAETRATRVPTVELGGAEPAPGDTTPGTCTFALPGAPYAVLAAGDRLGRYRVIGDLGRGGMGQVALAEDTALARLVAIKRLHPGLAADPRHRARLRREARIAAMLDHRAIVRVIDLVSEAGVDHIVMEHVAGRSLRVLADGRPMPVVRALPLVCELAEGLAHMHARGVVHRDLKTENVLVGLDGLPKLNDFGIARCLGQPAAIDDEITLAGEIVGTPRAMSPEQLGGDEVDPRSDLFSFGVMLYELLSGVSPFAAETEALTIMRVVNARHRALAAIAPVPRALSELVDHLLEKDPLLRPQSAAEALVRLRAAAPRTAPRSTPVRITGRRQVTVACVEVAAAGGGPAPIEALARALPILRAQVRAAIGDDGVLVGELGHRAVIAFGHPRPLEDAGRRAVEVSRALVAALAAADGAIAARAAVHAGPAIVTGGPDLVDELVLGDTLDHALELLRLAAPGEVRLSATAAELVHAGTADAGPLHGREPERAALIGAWHRACAGDGQIAMLVGEPGIGKSRLVRELERAAAATPGAAIVRAGAGDVRALRERVSAVTADGPLLVVLEDLHAIEPRPLDRLTAIFDDVAGAPILVLATTRAPARVAWPAIAPVARMHLARLEPAAIDAIVADALGAAGSACLRAAIVARAEGVPRVAAVLARAGAADGIPPALRDGLAAQLDQLGPAAGQVARAAAALGREIAADTVAGALAISPVTAARELDRLVAVEILVRRRGAGGAPRYAFRHGLLREAALGE